MLQRPDRNTKPAADEVGVLAHSCGVREPRELRRHHARIVQPNGRSVSLDELYPPVSSTPSPAGADTCLADARLA